MIIEFEGLVQSVEKTDYWKDKEWGFSKDDGEEEFVPHTESYWYVELPGSFWNKDVEPRLHMDGCKINFTDDPKVTPGMKVKIRIEIEQTFEDIE